MEITEYLPVDFRTQMEAETLCGAEEIRLRVGQPLEILYADEKEKEIGLLTEAHMREVLNYLSGYSVYALEEELRQGYFTLEGGHRTSFPGGCFRYDLTGKNASRSPGSTTASSKIGRKASFIRPAPFAVKIP